MKRLLSVFSLAAMLLLLGLAMPYAAQAGVPKPEDCTAVTGNGSVWPNSYVYYCGTATDVDEGAMQSGISQINGVGTYAMEKAGVQFSSMVLQLNTKPIFQQARAIQTHLKRLRSSE
jgi:hypothetical protein